MASASASRDTASRRSSTTSLPRASSTGSIYRTLASAASAKRSAFPPRARIVESTVAACATRESATRTRNAAHASASVSSTLPGDKDREDAVAANHESDTHAHQRHGQDQSQDPTTPRCTRAKKCGGQHEDDAGEDDQASRELALGIARHRTPMWPPPTARAVSAGRRAGARQCLGCRWFVIVFVRRITNGVPRRLQQLSRFV